MFKYKILLIMVLSLLISSVNASNESRKVSFTSIERSQLQQAQLLGPLNPQKQITFAVWLKNRNSKLLKNFIEELYDPKSASYQQFLTNEEYYERFSPSDEAVKNVEYYFKSKGLNTHRAYNIIHVTGSVRTIEGILGIKLYHYSFKNRVVYGPISDPKIDSSIAGYISGISDLSTIPYSSPKIRHRGKNESELEAGQKKYESQELHFVWNSFKPQALPTTTSLKGFTGQQIRIAYKLDSVEPIKGQTIDGTGQTIVLIDGCGTQTPAGIRNDANHFNTANNLTPLSNANFKVVKPDGKDYKLGDLTCSGASDWDGEIALDIQASHTMAPGANIVLVMTNDVNNTQVATALNTILNNNFTIGGFSNAYVVSNSWDNNLDLQTELLEPTLQTASARGLSINFAAGDCGDQTYNSSWECFKISNEPSIQYPVSSAYVTAISGTSMFVDNNYNYAFESGWGNYRNGHPYSGSMGGISKWRNFPSWQSPISNFTAGGYGTVGAHNRAIPDIAMDADYFTGLNIYQGGEFFKTGGASQSTPLFSGVLALVNQARALNNNGTQKPIGQAAPYFYTFNHRLVTDRALNLITPPHQIISGATPVDNAPSEASPPDSAFNIKVGADIITFNWDGVLSIVENQFWNDVVGVGSPNVPNFVNTMAKL